MVKTTIALLLTFLALHAQTRDAAPRKLLTVANAGALPVTCETGVIAFVAAAAAGQQIYECYLNVWTQQSGGGGAGACSTIAQGLVPATGGGTANFLRADCSFAAPPGGAFFTTETAPVCTWSASLSLSLAAVSNKSPTRFECGTMTADTTITFSGQSAGAGLFAVVLTENTPGLWKVLYGGTVTDTCWAAAGGRATYRLTQWYQVAADGTTVRGAGCQTTDPQDGTCNLNNAGNCPASSSNPIPVLMTVNGATQCTTSATPAALPGGSKTINQTTVVTGDVIHVTAWVTKTGTAGSGATMGIRLVGKDSADQTGAGYLLNFPASADNARYETWMRVTSGTTYDASTNGFRAGGTGVRNNSFTGLTISGSPLIEIVSASCTAGDTLNIAIASGEVIHAP